MSSPSSLRSRLIEAMDSPPKISQAALARACKVSQPTVNDWRSGKTKTIRGATLLAVSRALGVSPDWLATGKGSKEAAGQTSEASLSQLERIDPAILVLADRWVSFEEGLKLKYTNQQRLERLAAVYNLLAEVGGDFSPEQAHAFIMAAEGRLSEQGEGGNARTQGGTRKSG